jgi:hypothetical protein
MSKTKAKSIITCAPRYLPRDQWLEAAQQAQRIWPGNVPEGADVEALIGAGGKLALDVTKYWGKGGVKLTVGFLDSASSALKKRLLSHMNAWNKTANITFVETKVDPQVRIAFAADDGYWSYVGTDILSIPKNQPTMNLDSFSMKTPDSEFYRVVRHETGHTLGFPHEHMRKQLVDRLDRAKTLAYFESTQGWSEPEVIAQVLTPLEDAQLIATAFADQHSIMCYEIPGTITKDGKPIIGGTDIDASDRAFIATVYPKAKPAKAAAAPKAAAPKAAAKPAPKAAAKPAPKAAAKPAPKAAAKPAPKAAAKPAPKAAAKPAPKAAAKPAPKAAAKPAPKAAAKPAPKAAAKPAPKAAAKPAPKPAVEAST